VAILLRYANNFQEIGVIWKPFVHHKIRNSQDVEVYSRHFAKNQHQRQGLSHPLKLL